MCFEEGNISSCLTARFDTLSVHWFVSQHLWCWRGALAGVYKQLGLLALPSQRNSERARSSVFWFKHLSPKTPSSEVEQCLSDELQEFSKAAAERNDWSKIEFLLQIKAFSSGIKFKKPNVFYRSTSWLGCAYSLSPQISFPWQSPLKVLGFISLSMGLYKKLQFYATEFGCSCLYHDGICFIQLLVPENCSLCKYQNAKIKGW